MTRAKESVRSMTGFARAQVVCQGVELEAEAKSVNNRFLEVSVRAPKCFTALERELRAVLQKDHRRGRIDISINRRVLPGAKPSEQSEAAYDELDRLVASYAQACKRYGASGDYLGSFLAAAVARDLARPDEAAGVSEEEVRAVVSLMEELSRNLVEMREKEGTWLVSDVSKRLETITSIRIEVSKIAPELPGRFKERLEERLKALSPDVPVDPARLAVEVAFLADRVDVSEELSRLGSHLEQFKVALGGHPEGVGRKLDFLIQELSREFNTIGSKAQDARIQALVVDAKAELEKIREQVQNIE